MYDIGFRFFKKYWNQGYATEAAKACLDYGLNDLGMKIIIGRAMKANTASIKVLEKIGMTYWKPMDFHGGEGLFIKLKRAIKGLFFKLISLHKAFYKSRKFRILGFEPDSVRIRTLY